MPAQTIFSSAASYGPVTFGRPGNAESPSGFDHRSIGCANSELTITGTPITRERFNSCTGKKETVIDDMDYEVSLTVHEYDRDMYARAMYTDTSDVPAGSVTAETLPAAEPDTVVYLSHPKITASTLVLTDSAATPVTLTEGTHYAIEDAQQGRIRILDITGLNLPLKAAYSYSAYGKHVPSLTPKRTSLVWNGLAKYEGMDIIQRVTIAEVEWAPDGAVTLIGDNSGTLKLKGKVRKVPELVSHPDFKGYFSIKGMPV
jgi:hypothetical protein